MKFSVKGLTSSNENLFYSSCYWKEQRLNESKARETTTDFVTSSGRITSTDRLREPIEFTDRISLDFSGETENEEIRLHIRFKGDRTWNIDAKNASNLTGQVNIFKNTDPYVILNLSKRTNSEYESYIIYFQDSNTAELFGREINYILRHVVVGDGDEMEQWKEMLPISLKIEREMSE